MGYAATIGYFDGVHRGHQQVIRRLRAVASADGLQTLVITFSNHPLSVVCPGHEPQQLISAEEKVKKLRALGVDRVVMVEFTKEIMLQPAREFMEKVLRDSLDVEILMLGYDNRFGKRCDGEDFEAYQRYGTELGICVVEGPRPEECGLVNGEAVSSSLIRRLIDEGKSDQAMELMSLREV